MFSNFIGFVYVGGDPPKSPLIRGTLTETNGIQASPFKGNHQKIFPDFKLDPFKAESIQNRSTERLRPELVEGSRRSPKSKIEMTEFSPLNMGGWGGSKGLKTCPRVI